MATDTFVVAHDARDQHALDCAMKLASKQGARLYIVHVLEWSPYTFLTPEELAERHKVRQQELDRARAAVLEPALAKARTAGLEAAGELQHGNVVDVISEVADRVGAAMIVVGRSSGLSTRIFGSSASGLAQTARVPTLIVP